MVIEDGERSETDEGRGFWKFGGFLASWGAVAFFLLPNGGGGRVGIDDGLMMNGPSNSTHGSDSLPSDGVGGTRFDDFALLFIRIWGEGVSKS
eukprot:865123-Amorphochlora_amoeboformis.AAC.1